MYNNIKSTQQESTVTNEGITSQCTYYESVSTNTVIAIKTFWNFLHFNVGALEIKPSVAPIKTEA